jgi:sugar phosphate isomerase/epimerase
MPTLIENRTLEDNIDLCKELGLSFIELNMNFPEYQIAKNVDSNKDNINMLYKKADEAGIYYTIHLDENLNIADFNPLVREAYLETVHRTIDMAKYFVDLKNKYGKKECPLILNMHMHHGIYITLPDKKVQMYDRDFDVYMEYITQFVRACEKWIGDSDIKIAVENTDVFRGYEKRAVERMLKSDCFVLTWDIGHSKATGEKDVAFILEHKDRLKHFHIHDGSENPPKNHLALGDGEIDLVERLSLAKECGGRCVLETKTIEALRKSVEWLEYTKVE